MTRNSLFGNTAAVALVATLIASPVTHAASHGETERASAKVASPDGALLGSVEFAPTPSGQMHLIWQLENIPPGVHGIHVHETGDCSASDFTSAGGHLSGDAMHGVLAAGGPHPGDLPNAHVGEDGRLFVEHFSERLTMDMLMDDDGAAVIVHSGPDDYTSQPAGEAGERIACGVVELAR